MSYDLMVFEVEAAPRDREAFMAWYSQVTEWGEGHDYNDPASTTPRLRAWYQDMIKLFPPLNGPDSRDEEVDNPKVTGYSCAISAIYCDFRWSEAEAAYDYVRTLVSKHQLGFFDVSADDGEVWEQTTAGYERVHGSGRST